jgi:hypothetical protein
MTGGDNREDKELDSAKGDDLRERPGFPETTVLFLVTVVDRWDLFFCRYW